MADDRTLIRFSIDAQRRADAAEWPAPARPCAPGRAGANPAGNSFLTAVGVCRRHRIGDRISDGSILSRRPPVSSQNFLSHQQWPSLSPNFVGTARSFFGSRCVA